MPVDQIPVELFTGGMQYLHIGHAKYPLAKRFAYVGLAGGPSLIDTCTLAMKDVTAVGILSALPGLPRTIKLFAGGEVGPHPFVATTVGLDGVTAVLAAQCPTTGGDGSKIHVDPKISKTTN